MTRKFPEPQYLGAKTKLLPWISQFIPEGVTTALDAFAGSHSVSYHLKSLGYRVIANDLMSFSDQIGVALIENSGETLTESDMDLLTNESHRKADYTLMEDTFTGVFFNSADARFIDNYRANVGLLPNAHKQALALAVMNRSLTRKVTMGHFAHAKALDYANDPNRIRRNRSIAQPIGEIVRALTPQYNAAVFDNGKSNESHRANILDLLPTLTDVDLAYFDPPYCDSHADYQSFYHLLETYTEYWRDKEFVNKTRRYEPRRHSGFDRKRDAEESLAKLFEMSDHIPHWLISYNNRSFPSVERLAEMARKHRRVSIHEKEYGSSRGGKGSVAGSKEIMLKCEPW